MERRQIEKIARDCNVEVTYEKPEEGGFIIDGTNLVHDSVNEIFMAGTGEDCREQND